VTPFLKWAGGKRWLLQSEQFTVPANFDRLVEPFLGGAAVFFGLEPERALLSDVNEELIHLYKTVRDHPESLTRLLTWHHERHCPQHYYRVRAKTYQDPIWKAARTLYLNRTCWNGLYRVNRSGAFNVPIGTKSAVIYLKEDFQAISTVLSRATLLCCDFESTVDASQKGDFLFIDPPYTVKHNMNGFIKYNEEIFSWDDQVRLHAAVTRAAARGVAVVVTNADHASLQDLYRPRFRYTPIDRHSVLAGKSSARGATTEAMFTANLKLPAS
jgi:DNA adenine methylase